MSDERGVNRGTLETGGQSVMKNQRKGGNCKQGQQAAAFTARKQYSIENIELAAFHN